jgi:hypothetical protein
MQRLGTSKYKIFLILLGFQNLWNLIIYSLNVFNENVCLNVSYDFHCEIKVFYNWPCNSIFELERTFVTHYIYMS